MLLTDTLTVEYYHTILTTDLSSTQCILSYDWQEISQQNQWTKELIKVKNCVFSNTYIIIVIVDVEQLI